MQQVKVLSKKVTIEKDGKAKTFYRYFTYVMIDVIENGENLGQQKRSLEVHFTKDATKQLAKFTEKENIFAIIGGEIGLPFEYRYNLDENGVVSYPKNPKGEEQKPECWIRKVESFKEIPYTSKENTCKPILDDEQDTEPVEIVG